MSFQETNGVVGAEPTAPSVGTEENEQYTDSILSEMSGRVNAEALGRVKFPSGSKIETRIAYERRYSTGSSAPPSPTEEKKPETKPYTSLPWSPVLLICFALVADYIIQTMYLGLYPSLCLEFYGYQRSELGFCVGILNGAVNFGTFLTGTIIGFVTDYLGRKIPMLIGMMAGCCAVLVLVTSKSFEFTLVVLVLVGMVDAVLPVTKAAIADVTDKTNRGVAYGVRSAFSAIARTVWVFLCSVAYGSDYVILGNKFLFSGLIGIFSYFVGGIFLLFFLPETHPVLGGGVFPKLHLLGSMNKKTDAKTPDLATKTGETLAAVAAAFGDTSTKGDEKNGGADIEMTTIGTKDDLSRDLVGAGGNSENTSGRSSAEWDREIKAAAQTLTRSASIGAVKLESLAMAGKAPAVDEYVIGYKFTDGILYCLSDPRIRKIMWLQFLQTAVNCGAQTVVVLYLVLPDANGGLELSPSEASYCLVAFFGVATLSQIFLYPILCRRYSGSRVYIVYQTVGGAACFLMSISHAFVELNGSKIDYSDMWTDIRIGVLLSVALGAQGSAVVANMPLLQTMLANCSDASLQGLTTGLSQVVIAFARSSPAGPLWFGQLYSVMANRFREPWVVWLILGVLQLYGAFAIMTLSSKEAVSFPEWLRHRRQIRIAKQNAKAQALGPGFQRMVET